MDKINVTSGRTKGIVTNEGVGSKGAGGYSYDGKRRTVPSAFGATNFDRDPFSGLYGESPDYSCEEKAELAAEMQKTKLEKKREEMQRWKRMRTT